MRQTVELRIRRAGAEVFRLELGTATSKAALGDLYRRRDVLRRLHARGEADILLAIKNGQVTAEHVERLVDERGVEDYRRYLKLERAPAAANARTLQKHVEQFLSTIGKRGTSEVYRKALAHLCDHVDQGRRIGDLPWHEAAPRHVIGDAKNALRAALAANTIRTMMGAWSAFFRWAIDREQSEAEQAGRRPLLEANPVRTAKVWDPIEITRHRFLTWDEFTALLGVAAPPMRAQYATLALAGLRIDELMSMPAQHVRTPTHLHVGPFGSWAPKGYPRSKRGVRDIPLHRELLPLLEDYSARYAGEDRFFVNPNTGGGWTRGAFASRLSADVKAAGMVSGQWSRATGDLERKAEGITPHTLRHTLASWLAQRDVQLQKIAAILGDTVEMVERHYSHLLPSDLDRSIQRIGSENHSASGD